MNCPKIAGAMDARQLASPLEPVFDANSRVLVLGSFPSPASREAGINYGHPRNRFWRVLAALFDEPVAATVQRRRDQVLRHHIALWDVVASCTIEGASDASIRDVVPNDFSCILDVAPIEAVFCTGAKAAELYARLCAETTGLPCAKLPSTSPANAAVSFDALVDAYAVLLSHLHEFEPPVLDVPQVVELEQAIDAAGTPLAELMQRAGLALAHRAHALVPEGRMLVLCGSGNNGGDGWVAAAQLARDGHEVCVLASKAADELRVQPARDAALEAQGVLQDHGANILITPAREELDALMEKADCVIDALLGTGFSGEDVNDPYAAWIEAANAARSRGALLLSADVPSGLSAQTGKAATSCIHADHTLTMIVSKPGLARPAAGQVHLAPLAYIETLLASNGAQAQAAAGAVRA